VSPNRLPALSRVFWANLPALLSFAIFLTTAVARRRQPEVHKRLMLLAGISVVQPAMARIRQFWFPAFDGGVFALVWLCLLVGGLALHDLRVNKRIHPVTLFGGAFFLGLRAIAVYRLASSDAGHTVIRWLVE
jgi:hypothetical protein